MSRPPRMTGSEKCADCGDPYMAHLHGLGCTEAKIDPKAGVSVCPCEDFRSSSFSKMSDYERAVIRLSAGWGATFSQKNLFPKFRRYYESGERIKVRMYGQELTGTVGITTGPAPAFLLVRTKLSRGSPYVLTETDVIVAVQRHGVYVTADEYEPLEEE